MNSKRFILLWSKLQKNSNEFTWIDKFVPKFELGNHSGRMAWEWPWSMVTLIWGEGRQAAHRRGLVAAMTIGRRGAPVRWSAGCGWLDWWGWRAHLSLGNATGRVDEAGGAPETAVDGGRGTAAMASSGGVAGARQRDSSWFLRCGGVTATRGWWRRSRGKWRGGSGVASFSGCRGKKRDVISHGPTPRQWRTGWRLHARRVEQAWQRGTSSWRSTDSATVHGDGSCPSSMRSEDSGAVWNRLGSVL
jgi:hypothetical protein